MYPEAIGAAKKALESDANRPGPLAVLAVAYTRSGQAAEGRRLLAEMLDKQKRGEFPAARIADAYADLGDKENALYWLEKALEERSSVLLTLKVSEEWDFLRSDPRFSALFQRMHFPD